MPWDFTMCPGGTCPRRDRCYRHRALPVARQDYFGAPPNDGDACAHHVDLATLDPTEDAIRDRAYHLWLAAGRPEGEQLAHWHAARRALEAARDALLAP